MFVAAFVLITIIFVVCQIALMKWDMSIPDNGITVPRCLGVLMIFVYIANVMILSFIHVVSR